MDYIPPRRNNPLVRNPVLVSLKSSWYASTRIFLRLTDSSFDFTLKHLFTELYSFAI